MKAMGFISNGKSNSQAFAKRVRPNGFRRRSEHAGAAIMLVLYPVVNHISS
jgi:hypothetical protein